jgi:hypothetical protein
MEEIYLVQQKVKLKSYCENGSVYMMRKRQRIAERLLAPHERLCWIGFFSHLVKSFRTQWFITTFSTAHHWSPHWTRWIHSAAALLPKTAREHNPVVVPFNSHSHQRISLRSLFMLSFCLLLCLSSGFSRRCSPDRFLCTFPWIMQPGHGADQSGRQCRSQ